MFGVFPGSVQFSRSVVSGSLRLHRLQHAWLPCPSPAPGAYPNSCPSSRGCHPTISSSVTPSPPAFNLSQHELFFNESVLHIRWPKYSTLKAHAQDFPRGSACPRNELSMKSCCHLVAAFSKTTLKPVLKKVLGEGNGTSLQTSCLENPRDGGAW